MLHNLATLKFFVITIDFIFLITGEIERASFWMFITFRIVTFCEVWGAFKSLAHTSFGLSHLLVGYLILNTNLLSVICVENIFSH